MAIANILDVPVPRESRYSVIRGAAVRIGGEGSSDKNLGFALRIRPAVHEPVVLSFVLRNHARISLRLNMNGVKVTRSYLASDSDRSVQVVMEKAIREGGNFLNIETLDETPCTLSDIVVWYQLGVD